MTQRHFYNTSLGYDSVIFIIPVLVLTQRHFYNTSLGYDTASFL
jgi:hypothetical protein